MPGEPKMPKRPIRGLERPRVNVKDFMNNTQIYMNLAQLCDVSPGVRAEFAHQLSLVPVPKKKKPAKRAKPTVEPDSDVEMQSAQPARRATGKGKGRAVAQVRMVTPPAPSYPEPGTETQAGALKDEWSPSQCPSVASRGL
jgi:hypothetical protein